MNEIEESSMEMTENKHARRSFLKRIEKYLLGFNREQHRDLAKNTPIMRCPSVNWTLPFWTAVLLASLLVMSGCATPPVKSRIYQHTYSEVFQASTEAIERTGMFITAKDEDKGTISGNCINRGTHEGTYEIFIETLNTKPETKITINVDFGLFLHSLGVDEDEVRNNFFTVVQKVLSTYQ